MGRKERRSTSGGNCSDGECLCHKRSASRPQDKYKANGESNRSARKRKRLTPVAADQEKSVQPCQELPNVADYLGRCRTRTSSSDSAMAPGVSSLGSSLWPGRCYC